MLHTSPKQSCFLKKPGSLRFSWPGTCSSLFDQPGSSLLDLFRFTSIFLVPGSPKLKAVFQIQSHKWQTEGNNHSLIYWLHSCLYFSVYASVMSDLLATLLLISAVCCLQGPPGPFQRNLPVLGWWTGDFLGLLKGDFIHFLILICNRFPLQCCSYQLLFWLWPTSPQSPYLLFHKRAPYIQAAPSHR